MTAGELHSEALAALEAGSDKISLRQQYLGRSGKLTELLRSLKNLPEAARRQAGAEANALRAELEALFAEQTAEVPLEAGWSEQSVVWPTMTGHLHPETQFMRRLISIFQSLGYEYASGPEIETVEYNFDRLNVPRDHPARDIQDTFYLTSAERNETGETELVMRTQVTDMQIRLLENRRPPLRVMYPGRVFRNEATDARHLSSFFQFEALVIEPGANLRQLLWTLNQFAEQLIGRGAKARFRPSFFPFTEPSVEVDITCLLCQGKGCRVCAHTGWLESGGAGMVHPNVLREMQLDPAEHVGYAFGMGFDRLLMLSTDIPDIRLLVENDIRFLSQF